MLPNLSSRVRTACFSVGLTTAISLISLSAAFSQDFVVAPDQLQGVYHGDMQWADLDGDQDVDLIYNGFDEGAGPHTNIYENVNGTLQLRQTELPNTRNGTFAIGDYDNDGDQDILIAGLTETYTDFAHLYQNNGSFNFTLVDSSFELVSNPSVEMVDFDNDQDLDFVIAGATTDLMGMRIDGYRNDGGWFSPIGNMQLPSCGQCTMDWADVNADGFADVVLLGFDDMYMGLTRLYINQHDYTFTNDNTFNVNPLFNGVVSFADYDNDGDLDVLQSGMDAMDGFSKSNIIENEGSGWSTSPVALTGVAENFPAGSAWADLDNDGFQDLILSGRGGSQVGPQFVFDIFHNNGDKTFTNVATDVFAKVTDSALGIADFDNDGDLDIAASGYSPGGVITRLYLNQHSTGTQNSKPTGEDIYVILNDGESYVARVSDFTNTFADEDEGDVLQQIEISTLPAAGVLTLNGVPTTSGQIISVAELEGLVYTPAPADEDTVSFSFYYNDGKDNSEQSSSVVIVVLPPPHTLVLSSINDIAVFMPTPLPTIPFSVRDSEHDVNSLVLTATSSNQSVVPDHHLQISGSGESRTLRVKPGHHEAGTTTITISASDGATTASTTFSFTISRPGMNEGQLVAVSPNPFRSTLNIILPEGKSSDVVVTNLVGKKVVSTTLSSSTQLDLSDQPAGVYIVKIMSGARTLLKQRVMKVD